MTSIIAPFVSKYVMHTLNIYFIPETDEQFSGLFDNITTEERNLLKFVFDIANKQIFDKDVETLFNYNGASCLYQFNKKISKYYIYIIRRNGNKKYEYHLVKQKMENFTRNDGKVLHKFLEKHFRIVNEDEYKEKIKKKIRFSI